VDTLVEYSFKAVSLWNGVCNLSIRIFESSLGFRECWLPAKTLSLMKLYFLERQVAFVTDVHWVDVLEKMYKRGLMWMTADDFL
jgi:hypothetical protein